MQFDWGGGGGGEGEVHTWKISAVFRDDHYPVTFSEERNEGIGSTRSEFLCVFNHFTRKFEASERH